jgi:transmembrane sensor
MGQLSPEELETLAKKWLDGSITSAEETVFNQWYEQVPDPSIVLESADRDAEAFRSRLLERIRATVAAAVREEGEEARRKAWPARVAVAATVILLAVGSWLWVNHRGGNPSGQDVPISTSEKVSGRNGARLTLAGGRQIILDSGARGKVGVEGNSALFNSDGQLTYKVLDEKPGATSYNTLTTDRGNQYQLVLPDGSRVWLNAAASITYPTVFSGPERTVTMTGEAYFEVVHRDRMPFKVKVGNREIEDLGTHFNVNAYEDDSALKTTLLEGSVKVGNLVLHPGEQASIDSKGRVRVVKDADMDQVVAWKNGMFQFDHADLKSVMEELSRWYGVDVRFEGNAASRHFGGKISRSSNISEVLKILELSKVHFRIENKIIVVMP